MIARKKQNSPEEKYKFITYILNKMKFPKEHRKTEKRKQKRKMEKRGLRKRHPEIWVLETPLCTRVKGGLTVQLCGDGNVACKWINGEYAQGTKDKETLGKIQRILHSWWKRAVAKPDLSHRQHRETHLLAHRDEEKSRSLGKTCPQHGKQYEASGMEDAKTMAGAAPES